MGWREKSVPWALALGREPRLPSRQYLPSLEHRRALPGPLPVCRQHLSLTQVEPADSIKGILLAAALPVLADDSTLPVNFTTLCHCLAPFGNSLQILCLGGKKEGRAISEQKKGKTYPAGERDKDYQRLPFSRTHSRTCQAARAKYRGREEPGPGRGPRLRQPPLLSRSGRHLPPHHLLREK